MNAHHILMDNARNSSKKKRSISTFTCPAGCGARVSGSDVNDHLDRCLGVSNDDGANSGGGCGGTILSHHDERRVTSCLTNSSSHLSKCEIESTGGMKRVRSHSPSADTPPIATNAFSHMMKQSATLFSKSCNKENLIRHRFHLHNVNGLVTWSADDGDENSNWGIFAGMKGNDTGEVDRVNEQPSKQNWESLGSTATIQEIQWSTVIKVKGMKEYELTVSSSLPSSQGNKTERLVQKHSRLSVSQLKSCLQKSIRRRAPLPSVRVAMELADKSWSDFIRRLPIIVLEDCTLHPDFGLLVWLMVAESKGFTPCMSMIVRVMQIVFENASCAFRDFHSEHDCSGSPDDNSLQINLSLATPTPKLLSDRALCVNACDVFIRSMLLRAEYGGMKCDTQMLHSYARRWLKRFNSVNVPDTLLESLASASTLQPIYWWDVPRIIHEKARERSFQIITPDIVRPGGLPKLSFSDISIVGIDFHCSSVVEYLLSQREICSSIYKGLSQTEVGDRDNGKIAEQLQLMIWTFSSGINHRRPLFKVETVDVQPSIWKAVWEDVVKVPFNAYTTKFVNDRLV